MEQSILDNLKQELEQALKAKVEFLDPPLTFYSNGCASLQCAVSTGTRHILANGTSERVGEKIIEFSAIPAGCKQPDGSVKYYGYYVAHDPEIALYLLNRGYYKDRITGQIKADVLLPADYIEQVTPPDELVRQANARLVTSQNELEAYMAGQTNLKAENERLREQLAAMAAKEAKAKAKETVAA